MFANSAIRFPMVRRAWVLLACTALFACPDLASAEVRVGLVASITGSYATLGQWMRQAGAKHRAHRALVCTGQGAGQVRHGHRFAVPIAVGAAGGVRPVGNQEMGEDRGY